MCSACGARFVQASYYCGYSYLVFTYYSLLTIHYSLLTTHYSLLTTLTAHYSLLSTLTTGERHVTADDARGAAPAP